MTCTERSGVWIAAQSMADPERVQRSHELKVMRAYRGGLVCLNREYLDYPHNWEFKRYRIKHYDGYKCYVCGVEEGAAAKIHVHHIIFRSNSGTNSYRNLVTLCSRHHQDMHDHPIGEMGGEPAGTSIDQTEEEIDRLWTEPSTVVLPAGFDNGAYLAARPTFESAMFAFRDNGKSMRDLFGFLIQTFGPNVGRYVLRFAEEQRAARKWF